VAGTGPDLRTPVPRARLASAAADDDKYSRGVLGVVTGSTAYPGAAVLGVEAALHTGVGMLRYLGPARASDFVLHRRPEAVTSPGRVQAWLLGSGVDPDHLDDETAEGFETAASSGLPLVLDAGALSLRERATGPVVLTPHFRELARASGRSVDEVAADPAEAAVRAAGEWGCTVLVKGHRTHVASPGGTVLVAESAPTWLATAGAGDALGGVLGALVAASPPSVRAAEGRSRCSAWSTRSPRRSRPCCAPRRRGSPTRGTPPCPSPRPGRSRSSAPRRRSR
jgi:NAD(P)H-hydrate repair Nnr-like enzyme with NAD(P)H-hydrate dehydratase domain